jgi:hypothetical protein
MATYEDWNRALISYFTTGVPRGTKVHLSVDDDLINNLGEEFGWEKSGKCWVDDFLIAVRNKLLVDDQINVSCLCHCLRTDIPQYVGFLAITVLAAYRMADDEDINETNYFKRLGEVLAVTTAARRPPGLKVGSEEPLWKRWNQWLMRQGFQSSARPGKGRRDKYINYPISQSLLRCADKDRLCRLFHEKQWTKDWDTMTLFTNIRQNISELPKHLQQLLEDRQRYEAIAEVIHEVYQQWLGLRDISTTVTSAEINTRRPYLLAGLYRTEDPFLGQTNYYFYPKQQRGRQLESISVQQGDTIELLKEERPGWYFPLGSPLNASELKRGARYDIRDNPTLDRLVLPHRDFWILIPDPDNPDAGVYATWGTPPLGTPFILLCQVELLSDLHRLRDERLLEWCGEPIPPLENSEWVELDQCMVISQAWDAVFIKNSELKEALQPTVRLAISLSGGLRVPQQNAWLEEYPPQIVVFGFSPTAQLTLTRISDNKPIHFEPSVKTNNKISIKFPSPGDYLIEAASGGALSERFVRILPWDELVIASSKRHEQLELGSEYQICGSLIKRDSEIG